jgi:hypothetical protein
MVQVRYAWDRKAFLKHQGREFYAYFDSFSQLDVQVRRENGGVYSAETYLRALVPRIGVPRDVVEDVIPRKIREAEARLMRLAGARGGGKALRRLLEAEKVPWTLSFLEDRAEGGMPHTHGGVICFPHERTLRSLSSPRFVQTLVHERIHVLQRAFPRIARNLVYERLGLRPALRRRDLEPFLRARWRSNPDLDDFVYSDGVLAVFASHTNPASLGDVVLIDLFERGMPEVHGARGANVARSEHPFETIAYLLAAEAMKS